MASTEAILAGRDRRAARFAELERRANGVAPWLREARRAALARFESCGYPSLRDEAWRHTDVSPIANTEFAAAPTGRVGRADLAPYLLPESAGATLVFVNGRWAAELSSVADLPRGVVVQSLATALASGAPLVEAHLGRHTGTEQAFTALNTAFAEDGAWIHVPRGVAITVPIQLVFWSESATACECHPRILVVAEPGSQVTVVETWAGRGTWFTNAVTEVVVEEHAVVTHAKLQDESPAAFHVARVHAALGRGGNFTSQALAFGAALARNEVEVVFAGEGGECMLGGLYAAGGNQLSDNQTFVDHAQPHCTSNQLYKGVLTGAARGVFNGRVIVRKDAQKTDAHQTNRNVLLSEAALVDTKPQLEIYADDVRCTHGATIGRLDEEPLFYLQSRGIGRGEAQEILTHAFARAVVAKLQPECLRAGLEAWIGARVSRLIRNGGGT